MTRVADLKTWELIELVRKAVRDELAVKPRRRPAVPPPDVPASPEAVTKVRRRLRRQGVAA